MPDRKRRLGIDIIGEAPWGTHVCLFYQTQQQLIEILAPYLEAGVGSNEYCVWMVAEPLTVQVARRLIRREYKKLASYLKDGQIEILDRSPWQRENGEFNPQAMLAGWAEMERRALEKGFEGLRICGDMGWVEEADWEKIQNYEGQVDRETDQKHILALCAYNQEKCGTSKILDLISNHHLGLIQRSDKWEIIASSEYGQIKEALKASDNRYQALVNSAHQHIFMLSREGVYLESNRQVGQFGLENGEALVGQCLDDVFPTELAETYIQQMERVLATGLEVEFEYPMLAPDGEHEYQVTLYPIYSYGEIEAIGGISRDISESKRAEKAVRLAEERYRSIYENAVEGIFQSTPDGRFLGVNPAMARIFGYSTPDEMLVAINNHIESRVYVDPKRRADFVGTLAAEGLITGFENQNYRRDGSIIWTRTNARAAYDAEGKPAYYEGFLSDVTERTQVEAALLESEQRFRSLFDNATVGIYRTTPDGQILMANPAIIRMLGFGSFEEMASRDLEQDDFEPEYQRDQFRQLIETAGEVKGLEAIWNRKDGKQIYVRESAKAVRDSQGQVIYYEGTVEDITERKLAEQALRESEDHNRDLVENLHEFICTHDLQGTILTVNAWATDVLGYELDEILGKNLADFLTPESREHVPAYLAAIVRDGTARGLLNVQTRAGETRIWEYNNSLRTEGVANPIVRGMAIDITEQKQMETQLRAALAEKEVLLREVHHRVKNNLATISSLLELQAHASQDARVQVAFQESQQRIRSMTQIHEQLYRSESLTYIDMSQYVAGMADELRYIYTKGEIAVQADVGQVKLTIDQAIPCGLIINELITNALKYAFPAGQAGDKTPELERDYLRNRRVLVSLQAEGDQCRLIVGDNGVGLPSEFDIRITRTLGLRLVSRLAVQLGGELAVESTPGTNGGALFQVVFPIRK
jgi:PAS domain S-box-containing protein